MPLPHLADALLRVALLGSLFLVLAHIVALVMRGRSAAARHLSWSTVLLATLLLPLATLIPARLAWLPAGASSTSEVVDPTEPPIAGFASLGNHPTVVMEDGHFAGAARAEQVPVEQGSAIDQKLGVAMLELASEGDTPPSDAPATPIPWGPIGAWLWLIGTVLLVFKLSFAAWVARRAVRAARPASAAQSARFRRLAASHGAPVETKLMVSTELATPRTAGVLSPVVIAPAEEAWHESLDGETSLLHELSHVKRRDVTTQFIGCLASALYWWNPLAWSAAKAQRREAELCCDDAVLLAGTNPEDYADCLLSAARQFKGRTQALQLAMASPSGLSERIEAALDGERRRRQFSALARVGAWSLIALLAVGSGTLARAVQAPQPSPSQAEPIIVSQDGTGDHVTIQSAVDAAPEGAVIEVRPGEYVERVTLARTVTLKGAGWETCRIVSDMDTSGSPTLMVSSTGRASISGLKVTARGTSESGSLRRGSALMVSGGRADVSACAILGSPASGVVISGDATVVLENCLVAGAWAEGVVISQEKEGLGRVLVKGCTIRNNHHNEIQIRGAAPRTRVEGSRISGAGWHGIRYDGSAPEIVGNYIFGNERSGIYASGKTAARVTGNVFVDSGIGCWFQNRDTITHNTFVGNPDGGRYGGSSSAISIIGQSKPRIASNVIATWANAVSVGRSSSDGPTNKIMTEWIVQKNVLWKNGKAVKVKGVNRPLEAAWGNVEGEPGFVDAAAGNFALKPDSLALANGAGAPNVLPPESPWALQEEEKAVALGPDSVGANRRRQAAAAKAAAQREAATDRSKAWVEGALQIQDAELRANSIASILEALNANEAGDVEAGLTALSRIGEVRFDKAPFAVATRRLAGTLKGQPRVQAFYGLNTCRSEPTDADLDMLLKALAESPDSALMTSASHLLMIISGGELVGPAGEATLALLNGEEVSSKEVLRGLWGAHVSPELEAKILELADDGSRIRSDAIYFGLSTLRDKGPKTLDALYAACQKRDSSASRALWGLTHGVPAVSHSAVADFLLRLFEARSSGQSESYCLRGIAKYAGEAQLPKLKELVANELVAEEPRAKLQQTILEIEAILKDGGK